MSNSPVHRREDTGTGGLAGRDGALGVQAYSRRVVGTASINPHRSALGTYQYHSKCLGEITLRDGDGLEAKGSTYKIVCVGLFITTIPGTSISHTSEPLVWLSISANTKEDCVRVEPMDAEDREQETTKEKRQAYAEAHSTRDTCRRQRERLIAVGHQPDFCLWNSGGRACFAFSL